MNGNIHVYINLAFNLVSYKLKIQTFDFILIYRGVLDLGKYNKYYIYSLEIHKYVLFFVYSEEVNAFMVLFY